MRFAPDDSGFTAWYERESPSITAAVARTVRDVSLAEEAVAEAFARAYARWGSVSRMRSPEGWVVRVALNYAMGRFRRLATEHRSRRRIGPTTAAAPDAPDSGLWAAVDGLPERMRAAVLLRYVADLPEAAIAEVLGVSRGTVATQLSRARTQLRKVVTEESQR